MNNIETLCNEICEAAEGSRAFCRIQELMCEVLENFRAMKSEGKEGINEN